MVVMVVLVAMETVLTTTTSVRTRQREIMWELRSGPQVTRTTTAAGHPAMAWAVYEARQEAVSAALCLAVEWE